MRQTETQKKKDECPDCKHCTPEEGRAMARLVDICAELHGHDQHCWNLNASSKVIIQRYMRVCEPVYHISLLGYFHPSMHRPVTFTGFIAQLSKPLGRPAMLGNAIADKRETSICPW